jgi:transposase
MTISRQPYRSDLSDARWALIEPILTRWRARRVGLGISLPCRDLREIVNAILYVNRTGIAWECLPHDFPPHKTVYDYFAKWNKDGTTEEIHDALRGEARKAAGRGERPSAAGMDSQTVGGRQLLDQLAEKGSKVSKVWVDSGYKRSVVERGAGHGIDVEAVAKEPGQKGLKPLPKRWVVERALGWLMTHRRLARDYETLPESSRAMIHWAMIDNMSKRLAGESTQTWRDDAT